MEDSRDKWEDLVNKDFTYHTTETNTLSENKFEAFVREYLTEIGKLLIEKNKSYGNSAIDPIRVFSKADRIEQIKVRIDDKLNRIMQGNNSFNEDTEKDLIGYLILKKYCEL